MEEGIALHSHNAIWKVKDLPHIGRQSHTVHRNLISLTQAFSRWPIKQNPANYFTVTVNLYLDLPRACDGRATVMKKSPVACSTFE